jgi:hypothetical protein
MAEENKKLFYPETLPGDVQLLHKDGGGILMNNDGRFIFGTLSDERLKQLYTENFNGNLKTNFNYTSIIGIMNQNSEPRVEMQEGNTNRTTIINPNDNLMPAPQPDICGTEIDDKNNEFREIAKVISYWEDFNSNFKSDSKIVNEQTVKTFEENYYPRDIDTYKLYFPDQTLYEIIAKNYPPDPSKKFINLGWGRYGSDVLSLDSNITFIFNCFWKGDEYDTFNQVVKSNIGNFIKKSFQQNKKIYNLPLKEARLFPPGFRSLIVRSKYNTSTWVARLLTALGPDYLDTGLGITKLESTVGLAKSLSDADKIQKFSNNYEKIIDLYNGYSTTDKIKFLSTLAQEHKDWYGRFVDQGSDKRFVNKPNEFKTFYNTYIDLALAVAIKYVDCTPEFTLEKNITPPTSTPIPTPIPSARVKSVVNVEVGDDAGIYDIDLGEYEVDLINLPDEEPIPSPPLATPAASPTPDNGNILIVGDSISVELAGTWSYKFKKLIEGPNSTRKVKILAIGGKRVTDWMKPELDKELKRNKYSRVLIYGGVNDLFSPLKVERVIKDIQYMANKVVSTGAKAFIIVGYDSDIDMDYNNMKLNPPYVTKKEGYIPYIEKYRAYQLALETDTLPFPANTYIIDRISVGKLGDGIHPGGNQTTILSNHIKKYFDLYDN